MRYFQYATSVQPQVSVTINVKCRSKFANIVTEKVVAAELRHKLPTNPCVSAALVPAYLLDVRPRRPLPLRFISALEHVGLTIHPRPLVPRRPQYFYYDPSADENTTQQSPTMKSFACREAPRLLSRSSAVQRAPIASYTTRWERGQRRGFRSSRARLAVKPYLLADIGEGTS